MSGFKKRDSDAAMIFHDAKPDDDVERDHIKPRDAGGADDVANIQILTTDGNRHKSNHSFELRRWQAEFISVWQQTKDDSFLCVVIPGGGKTLAGLKAAHDFILAANDRAVLVVVPRINLQHQWRLQAERMFGLKLQTKEFGTNFKSGFNGGVTTYQSLESNASLFRHICSRRPTIVILDEPHHLTEYANWGAAAKTAFELSRRRLLLSGTPFRTDGRAIPFVRYDGAGVCIPHFRYDYPDALNDVVVRSLAFDYSRGSFEEAILGEARRLQLHGQLNEEEAADRLRPILNPSGDFVAEIIRLAHEKLIQVRQNIDDAAAMAVCMDIMHAQQVAAVIRRVTGKEPRLIVSDEDVATDTVDRFRHSKAEWLVAVQQVSEGTDIPRLQVLCYLTNVATELAFRQLIGRVSRVRFQETRTAVTDEALQADLEAYVYLPADPRLIAHAENIKEAQLRALKTPVIQQPRDCDAEHSATPRIFLSSEHEGVDVAIVAGKSYTATDYRKIEEIAAFGVTVEKAAKIFDKLFRTSAPEQATERFATEEEQIEQKRRECSKNAFRLSKLLGVDVSEVHMQWPRQRTMGLNALNAKNDELIRRIAELTK